MDLRTIVVGVDGSANSLDAASWAADLAGATGAEIVAVHALGLLDRLEPGGPQIPTQKHREEIADRVCGPWSAPLADAGVPCRHVLHDGNPVQVLLRTIEEEDADLVVLGSRGVGGSPALLMGSTSSQVAQLATCPVTIVPPAAHRSKA